jgi:hypothetical protein
VSVSSEERHYKQLCDSCEAFFPMLWRFKKLRFCSGGGGKRDRTADLLHAMQALSQLSYTPLAEQKRDFKEQISLCKYPLSDYMRLFLHAACNPSQRASATP